MKRKTERTIIAAVIIAALVLIAGYAYKQYVKMQVAKTVFKSASTIGGSLVGGPFTRK